MNNKGFTLIELLAIIAILALVASIGSYAVISYINTAKEKADNLLISNIKTASQEYMEECTSGVSTLNCSFGNEAKTIINTNLQTLADYNFLSVTNNIVSNSKQENIGNCTITISKKVDTNYNVTYTITSNSTTVSGATCPVAEGGTY
jgi:prepilin-type N-terminal cleavage/methylation domain-containing protein